MCGDFDRECLRGADRLLGGRQLDRELWRNEIPDLELGRADRRRLRIETELDLPGADARIARQRKALMVSPQPIGRRVWRELPMLDLDPVGAQQSNADRQARHRLRFIVAYQRHELDRLTGPVDAAIGVE